MARSTSNYTVVPASPQNPDMSNELMRMNQMGKKYSMIGISGEKISEGNQQI